MLVALQVENDALADHSVLVTRRYLDVRFRFRVKGDGRKFSADFIAFFVGVERCQLHGTRVFWNVYLWNEWQQLKSSSLIRDSLKVFMVDSDFLVQNNLIIERQVQYQSMFDNRCVVIDYKVNNESVDKVIMELINLDGRIFL